MADNHDAGMKGSIEKRNSAPYQRIGIENIFAP